MKDIKTYTKVRQCFSEHPHTRHLESVLYTLVYSLITYLFILLLTPDSTLTLEVQDGAERGILRDEAAPGGTIL